MKISKYFIATLLSSALFINCKNTGNEPKSDNKVTNEKKINANAKIASTSFNIEGMTCAIGCAKTIEKELTQLDGVQKATVNFDNKTATIEFDSNIQTPESLVKTVESTGDGETYKVSNIKS
ncbi:MAG TPA: heavy metal-associated domain-containing protein [Flavobacterium sp.]|nr:heavy metal-associated domain-containing protein [Flavobacterium sp.]